MSKGGFLNSLLLLDDLTVFEQPEFFNTMKNRG